MGKKLSEMSLEELWLLFPIVLTEHKEEWSIWYEEEKEILTTLLPKHVAIHHIGSIKARGVPVQQLMNESRNAANDPADFFEYIMFSWIGCGHES